MGPYERDIFAQAKNVVQDMVREWINERSAAKRKEDLAHAKELAKEILKEGAGLHAYLGRFSVLYFVSGFWLGFCLGILIRSGNYIPQPLLEWITCVSFIKRMLG